MPSQEVRKGLLGAIASRIKSRMNDVQLPNESGRRDSRLPKPSAEQLEGLHQVGLKLKKLKDQHR